MRENEKTGNAVFIKPCTGLFHVGGVIDVKTEMLIPLCTNLVSPVNGFVIFDVSVSYFFSFVCEAEQFNGIGELLEIFGR